MGTQQTVKPSLYSTVGVAVVGISNNVPVRWSSPQVRNYRLVISQVISRVQWLFLVLAHRSVGRITRTNAFQVMFRVIDDIHLLLVLGAQKVLRICCTPRVG